ncbi:hypothetical protein SAMD00019534_030410 [Acytostelium subglobosum LB1]|uniref:hypothetical protein n=1 Tax=Acytostelium subglobosum LB1 TaxID=1410327 RepID=UPI00064509AA|nr:hypothetical protein SAMD00019534_030410 [Acytostelium subglobosum LB1]GAM19866.1 hypothetical protein SAMD00019534_030410 [Acytostelium subglobosum LB1]|eukprot:XP_012756628.1 hypothetical protein SAMD00019534_030410 [Acytostelium subglobosum LB1]
MLRVALLFTIFVCVAVAINHENNRPVVIDHGLWTEVKSGFYNKNHLPPMGFKRAAHRQRFPVRSFSLDAVPTAFDARQQWPQCETIGAIQNQAECGSCWAFGAIESISDRYCIQKNTSIQLSFQDLVTCDTSMDGCNGGDAYSAYKWVQKTGVVSAECQPYTIPTCPPAQQPCLNFVDTPACVKKCANDSLDYESDKHHVTTVYSLHPAASVIQTEIMTNGPVEACFTVYEDFVGYKSGIYVHTTGKDLGGHCVKIIGWGAQNGTPYWIVNNSWTTSWGNQGQFWIKMGVDECGIESDVVAGMI